MPPVWVDHPGFLMKLASFKVRGRDCFGAVVGEGVVDLKTRLAPKFSSVLELLRRDGLDEDSLYRHQLREPPDRLRRSGCTEIPEHVFSHAWIAGGAWTADRAAA